MKRAGSLCVVVVLMSGSYLLARTAQTGAGEDTALKEKVIAAERMGLDALKAGDVNRFASTTADEAVFVDDRGPATKADVVRNVNGFTLSDYTMEDVRFVRISANTGLIVYKIEEKGNSHGREFTAEVYVSSVWTERGGKWQCLFSQETAAAK